MAAVKTQAATDGVKTELPAKPVVNVRGRGGPFDDKAIQEALLSSMDWQTAITNEFPGGESTVFGLIGDGAPSNLAFQPLDLEAARGLIERSGLVGTPVTVIVDDSEHAPNLAKNYTAALEDIYLRVEFVAMSPNEGAKLYEDRGSQACRHLAFDPLRTSRPRFPPALALIGVIALLVLLLWGCNSLGAPQPFGSLLSTGSTDPGCADAADNHVASST